MIRAALIVFAAALPVTNAVADEGATKYNITALEKAACATDAMRMCSHTYPDEDRLLACMRGRVSDLSLVCATTFKAGLKRRGIPL